MRVPKSGPSSRAAPLRRSSATRKIDANASISGADAARNIQDTSIILGIPPEEMTPKVRAAIMALMVEVDSMRQELELAHRKISELEKLADQDGMLAISNRRAFVREMTRMISYSQRYGINSALVYLDLNDLKAINDKLGHAAGDAALTHLSNIIVKNLRDSDIVGRLGGDEFGIILPKASNENALIKAKGLADMIQKTPFVWKDKEITLHVAYGIHPLIGTESADQALDKADQNMYAHKKELKKE